MLQKEPSCHLALEKKKEEEGKENGSLLQLLHNGIMVQTNQDIFVAQFQIACKTISNFMVISLGGFPRSLLLLKR